MIVNDSVLVQEGSKRFCCMFCNYKSCRKSQYDRHLATDKHKKMENDSKMIVNDSDLVPKSSTNIFTCECGKAYKYDSGYYRHKKQCNGKDKQSSKESHDKEVIMLLIKENSELKHMMMKVIENGTYNTTNNNSHNKTFNLQFFLNETCKDAMNIMDFVDSINLQLTDLENVGKLGYVEGISNIIIKNLKDLDITERPIHCTDKKREILYVKDDDKWEKEDEEKKKIKRVIKKVANKNIMLLQNFKEAHPDCIKSSSKFSDQYDKIIIESMGGSGDNDLEKEEKIIQRISKNVTIEKDSPM